MSVCSYITTAFWRQRQCCVYKDGLTQQEIALHLGVSPALVRSRVQLPRGWAGESSTNTSTTVSVAPRDGSAPSLWSALRWHRETWGGPVDDSLPCGPICKLKNIDLYLHQQGIDTTTPFSKVMFQICGVIAEFERVMIRERVKAGLDRARTQGKTLGRPLVIISLSSHVSCYQKLQGFRLKNIQGSML